MTTRNHVWSNNGDIANGLEWPLTVPSTHFCKFWGFCPFFPNHYISLPWLIRGESDDAYWASELDRKLKFPTFKNPRWRKAAILKIRKIGHISGTVRPIFTKFRMMMHIGLPNRTLKFSTFENPRWRSLTDEHLTEQHWQPVFLFSKPIVSIHVCCSYIELSRSKLHKMGDLQFGNWDVNCHHSSYISYAVWMLNMLVH